MANESFRVEDIEAAIDRAAEAVGIAPLQRDAIRTFILGRDVFVCLPTVRGGSRPTSKSTLYAFPLNRLRSFALDLSTGFPQALHDIFACLLRDV